METHSVPGRPRPVAAPALDALAGRGEEVARRWLAALVEARPLAEAATVPVAVVAAEGPAACTAVLDAVRSDAALDELSGLDLRRLAGVSGGPEVVAAAEALRRSVLDVVSAHTAHGDAALLVAISDRLAHVCARLAAPATVRARAREEAVPARALTEPAEEPTAREPAGRAPAAGQSAAPLWLAALDRQIAAGGRFALVRAEVDDAERLRLSEGDAAAQDLFGRAGRAVRSAVRRGDLLAHEDDGRMWIIAPDAGRAAADALAARVGQAVEGSASPRGIALTVSLGIALYPDDGRRPDDLTGLAEEAALASRAGGARAPDKSTRGPRLVR